MTLTSSIEEESRMRVDIVQLVTSMGSMATVEQMKKNPLVDFTELEMYLTYNTAFMPCLWYF